MRILRVFPRRTKATPDDDLVAIGDPGLFRPQADEVHVSCAFTWDIPEANRLVHAWSALYPVVRHGGPAYGSTPGEFTPGLYMAPGYTITSRGCPNRCPLCLVPTREGPLRLLEIQPGHDILDNNILACPRAHVERVLHMLSQQRQPARFTGGLEACRVQPWFAARLAKLRLDVAYTAFDHDGQRPAVERAIHLLRSAAGWSDGTTRRKLGCYVLIGYPGDTLSAAEERLTWILKQSVRPFPMYFRGFESKHTRPRAWRDLVGKMLCAFRPTPAATTE